MLTPDEKRLFLLFTLFAFVAYVVVAAVHPELLTQVGR